MFIFLIVLITLIAVLLMLVVLVQSGKGGGLAGIAAGGATTQILGTRQAPDILEKATWTLATAFIVLCILTNFAVDRGEQQESVIQQQAQGARTEQPVLPPPADGGAQQNAPEGGNN
ncbi:preprotein translocase subunit SecG [Rhodocaloribacter litoris]|uniref:preprotein translocase subunit SecG n=1 Tax=Rhodocaloribacter litoris TaxID=2558931 RepID=UPI001422E62D|nr:preprotein translocase subunit SecG [Rhodocaloribacter litoris]QXD14197.1 preprotein translocase subunit SecG [Rhodocaloribacter litoris]GIV59930.1 MAG: preprotein translocase subunit SecG [Rhodothermaceae bacterium]